MRMLLSPVAGRRECRYGCSLMVIRSGFAVDLIDRLYLRAHAGHWVSARDRIAMCCVTKRLFHLLAAGTCHEVLPP
jgi:hypothetical protein